MSVTTTNLIQGPATLYAAVFGALEPADVDTPFGVDWNDLGGTQDGVSVSVELSYAELSVDQIIDIPGQTPTKRAAKIKTNLAEATLENWALALNELAASVAVNTFTPTNGIDAFKANYVALGLDGIAPGGFTRRVIVRRALQIGNVESAYKKDGQTLLPVEWASHFVSNSIAPFLILDGVA